MVARSVTAALLLLVGVASADPQPKPVDIKDWKAKGLPAPEKESHWVRMGDHYVLVQITNGVVLAIQPAS